MEYFIGFVIGALVAWKIADWLHLGSLVMILKEFNITDEQIRKVLEKDGVNVDKEPTILSPAPKNDSVVIKVEQHGEQFYAFELHNDRFIAQGVDPEDLLTKILERSPKGTKFECPKEYGGDILLPVLQKVNQEQ